jgi:hypothetical protein
MSVAMPERLVMKRGKVLLLLATVVTGCLVGLGTCFSSLLYQVAPFLL